MDEEYFLKTALLPENYEYHVEKCDYKTEDNFSATLRVKSITGEPEFLEWLSVYTKNTKTDWRILHRPFATGRQYANFAFAKDFICHLSSRNKTAESSKNQGCCATLKVRIKKNTKDVRYILK
jgi:hypothetical protein